MDSDSDSSIESEDEVVDPYPLEGKYKDEADKRECVSGTFCPVLPVSLSSSG